MDDGPVLENGLADSAAKPLTEGENKKIEEEIELGG